MSDADPNFQIPEGYGPFVPHAPSLHKADSGAQSPRVNHYTGAAGDARSIADQRLANSCFDSGNEKLAQVLASLILKSERKLGAVFSSSVVEPLSKIASLRLKARA